MSEEDFPQVIAPESSAFLQQAKERIAEYAKKAKAENTWKAYQSDFEDFTQWCSDADMIKKRVAAVGLDSEHFSSHSLRSGLITAAAQARVSERIIARQSGHKSIPVLRGYIREGSIFTDSGAAKVGL